MTIVKELAVVTRIYTDKQGNEKKVWKNIGAIHTSSKGSEYIVLDPLINLAAIPRKDGDDRVFVSMFEPKEKQPQSKGTGRAGPLSDFAEDVPF